MRQSTLTKRLLRRRFVATAKRALGAPFVLLMISSTTVAALIGWQLSSILPVVFADAEAIQPVAVTFIATISPILVLFTVHLPVGIEATMRIARSGYTGEQDQLALIGRSMLRDISLPAVTALLATSPIHLTAASLAGLTALVVSLDWAGGSPSAATIDLIAHTEFALASLHGFLRIGLGAIAALAAVEWVAKPSDSGAAADRCAIRYLLLASAVSLCAIALSLLIPSGHG